MKVIVAGRQGCCYVKTLFCCYVKTLLLLCEDCTLLCEDIAVVLLCEGCGVYRACKHWSLLFHVCHIFATVLCEDIVSVMWRHCCCYVKTLSVCYVKAVLSTEPASTGRHCFTSVISSLLCHVKSLICYVKTLWLLCEDTMVVMWRRWSLRSQQAQVVIVSRLSYLHYCVMWRYCQCYVKTLLFCYVKAVVSTEPINTGRRCFTSVISSLLQLAQQPPNDTQSFSTAQVSVSYLLIYY